MKSSVHKLCPPLLFPTLMANDGFVSNSPPVCANSDNHVTACAGSNVENIGFMGLEPLNESIILCIPYLKLSRRITGKNGPVVQAFDTPHVRFTAFGRLAQGHGSNSSLASDIVHPNRAVVITRNNCIPISPSY